MSTATSTAAHTRSVPGVAFPLTLALIAGTVDVTTFVLLQGMFSAHVTGNLVGLVAGLALEQRRPEAASALSVAVFVTVAAAVTGFVNRSTAAAWTWVQRLLVVQLAFVLAAGVVAVTADAHRGSAAGTLELLLAAAGMATQNTLLHLTFTRVPTTAVMTGNLVAATVALTGLLARSRSDLADRVGWHHSWPLIAGFAGGCLVGGAACGALHAWAWVLPVILCTAAAGLSLVTTAPAEVGQRR